MKRFVFTLQRLYEVKASEEEQKRKVLQELTTELEGLQATLHSYIQTFDEQKREYGKKFSEGMNRDELNNYGSFFHYINDQIIAQNKLIAECQVRVDACRQELLKLINEQKVLDGMREEQLTAYNAEVQKAYDKEIEDFMQSRM